MWVILGEHINYMLDDLKKKIFSDINIMNFLYTKMQTKDFKFRVNQSAKMSLHKTFLSRFKPSKSALTRAVIRYMYSYAY